MPVDDTEIGCNESVVNQPDIFHQGVRSGDTSSALADETGDVKEELQEVASAINEADRIVLFVGAGISTNCGIPVSIYLVPLAVLLMNYSGLSV